jgi:hypothetical protein
MSALSRRIRETNDELEIEQSNQELREQRGIARSPSQDVIDEDEYYDRHNIHKENVGIVRKRNHENLRRG